MPRVTITNLPATIDADSGTTILEAALHAGLPFPHGCRAGDCGACVSRLVAGQVDGADAHVDGDESGGEVILACRARARTEVTIEWLGEADEAVPPVRTGSAVVRELQPVARDIVRVRLEVQGAPLFFRAGQYVDIAPEGYPARSFSMANTPDDPLLEFHVRHFPAGATSDHIVNAMRVGDTVTLSGPFGNAYLRHGSRPLLAIAGSTGLAPVRSIVLAALHGRDERPLHVYFGVNDEVDLYGLEELERLAARVPCLRFTPVLFQPSAPTARRTGLVQDAVAADFAALDGWCVHIAGPPPMVEAAQSLVLARGVDPLLVFADPFLPHQPGRRGWRAALRQWWR